MFIDHHEEIKNLNSLILMLGILGEKIDCMLDEISKIEKTISTSVKNENKSNVVLAVDAHDG